ncbi:MAG: hypothetical protein OEZ09_17055, partial [Betaproteobacteria bacterium]|nr:hypothetical protein [Betaproteobacteria bacterium]
FRDIRKFGKIGLYPRDAASGELVTEPGGAAVFAEIGPEPLDAAFDVRAFRRRLRARSGRLKSVLLDQSFVAGIGNIYADEALWLARLHPLRSASSLRPRDERRLYDAIRSILAEAISRRGSSVDDYTAPDGDGSMQDHLAVYQRTGLPCRRCGRAVRRLVLGTRATHFCSWCQRLSRADRKAAAAPLRTLSGAERKRGPRWSDLGTRSAAATRRAAARASASGSPSASPTGPPHLAATSGTPGQGG